MEYILKKRPSISGHAHTGW